MQGKKIIETKEIDNGYMLLVLDDGQVVLVKVISTKMAGVLGLGAAPETEEEETEEEETEEEETEEEEEEGEELTAEDLLAMDFEELSELCTDSDLDTDPDDFDEDDMVNFQNTVAKELEIKLPKPTKVKKGKEPEEEEEEEEDYTKEDIKEMDFEELSELCEEADLGTDPDDYDEDEEKKFRKAIIKELKL